MYLYSVRPKTFLKWWFRFQTRLNSTNKQHGWIIHVYHEWMCSSFSLSLAGLHPPLCASSLKAAISNITWCLNEITFNSCYRALFSDLQWPRIRKFSFTALTGLHMAACVNSVFDGRQKPAWKNEHRPYCAWASASERMLVNVRIGSILPWHWDWSVPTVVASTDSRGWPLTQRSQCFSIWPRSGAHPIRTSLQFTHPDVLFSSQDILLSKVLSAQEETRPNKVFLFQFSSIHHWYTDATGETGNVAI